VVIYEQLMFCFEWLVAWIQYICLHFPLKHTRELHIVSLQNKIKNNVQPRAHPLKTHNIYWFSALTATCKLRLWARKISLSSEVLVLSLMSYSMYLLIWFNFLKKGSMVWFMFSLFLIWLLCLLMQWVWRVCSGSLCTPIFFLLNAMIHSSPACSRTKTLPY
jgi:hypothetical protein